MTMSNSQTGLSFSTRKQSLLGKKRLFSPFLEKKVYICGENRIMRVKNRSPKYGK